MPKKREWGTALGVAAAMLLVCVVAVGQRSGEPRRSDVIARFTSGGVTLAWGDASTTTQVTGGRLSISTDNPRCGTTLGDVCSYTINELRLEAMNPFSLADQNFDGVIVGTTGPAYNQLRTFLGATSVRGVPFYVIGNVNGARFSFYGAEDPSSYLTVGDLQMGPGTTSAVVLGRLAGTIEGRPATIRFDVTADAPFENRPPYLDPTAPAEIVTQCVANVPIEPGLTDVDGDVIATWAEIDGHGIGGTTAPVVLPLGAHVVTVGAEDRYSALGLGNVSVHVVSDGTVPLEPGTELLELAVPRGTVGSQFALVASETLTLMPNVSVTAGAVGGPVASLGDLELAVGASTGEAWVDDDASLANRARIRGALHLGGDLSATSSAVIEGAVTHDGPFTPHETLRVVIPVAGVGPDVHLGPGEEAVLSTGAHGVVELGPRARLVLAHGMHTVRSLSVSPNAEIVVAGDATVPTIVRVEEGFSWHGSAVSETGPALVVVLMSADSVQVHSTFEGWLVAPTAEVVLLPGASPHRGGVFARSIRVQPNVLVERVAMDFALPPNVLDACALTPILRCIRDNPDGSATARFGYSSLLPHIGAVVALGPANRIHPELSPSVDHQAFLPVGDDVAFEVTFTDEVRWILGSRSAVATRESPRCP